ncbi:hypothetical protein I302_107256 [Kwoniella bestiolae CBS 10118]|uniref:Uncharacterized protein n=1 Tax=Kwoniella bestiolae CBS 10118 TaxID=1296100 RepID=A0A1B9FZ23_9TREE|nr:hypothetical protein I302_07008 [Kwoniella bestiolae CBS 10118]OCF24022.1 hypothetical protein I302_07008 [Kwoniella bestiolae CBS 10118]
MASSSSSSTAPTSPPPYLDKEFNSDDLIEKAPVPGEITTVGPGMTSHAKVSESGTVNIELKLNKTLPDLPEGYAQPVREIGVDKVDWRNCPEMFVVIFIVGSRGDVQPYISLALEMIRSNGHTVRIASHGEFASLGLQGRLEFYDVGGDPKELMAYMVKNPGLLPGFESLTNGDIPSKKRMTSDMLRGFYRSTFCPDQLTGRPFTANAIISNPPAFGHIHIAEALGIPLHMSFTMPWSPSTAFRHPLANILESNAEPGLSNYLSYALVDMLTWQGLGEVINKFRKSILGLDSLSSRLGPSVLDRMKIPWTYCWSDRLVPKPKDWKENIDISGFYFYENQSNYTPDKELVEFLGRNPAPIYIGFGSIVIDNPRQMTEMIFEAVRRAGVRAIISSGWAGLGDDMDTPEDVLIVKGNIAHDWLFAEGRIQAVCHHGGAGTTAIGLKNGLPTIVVPFFGDQKFWGEQIHARGAGPSPIPYKHLNVANLTEAIRFVLSPKAQVAAAEMGRQMRLENGEKKGVDSFHKHLPLLDMRCDVDPSRVAIWWSDQYCLKLSGAVAGLLAKEEKLDLKKLIPHRPREYETSRHHEGPWTGSAGGIFHTITYTIGSVAELFYKPHKGAVNTFLGIPKAAVNIVGDLYEGFDNVPELMNSETRDKRRVTDFTSGLKEGGRGLFWGVGDAITGLVTEPIAGAQKDGLKGFGKGVGKSYVNLIARPAAGALGVFVLPAYGMAKSTRDHFRKSPEKVLQGPLIDISVIQSDEMTSDEKRYVMQKFDVLVKQTKGRKKKADRRLNRLWLLPED